MGLAVFGVVIGIVGVIVIIQITLGDSEAISLGNVDSADAIKAVCLSFIQVFTLLTSFPIFWPDLFVVIFQIGGAVTVLGQHLVNVQCMFQERSQAEVFYALRLVWAVAPFALCAVLRCCL